VAILIGRLLMAWAKVPERLAEFTGADPIGTMVPTTLSDTPTGAGPRRHPRTGLPAPGAQWFFPPRDRPSNGAWLSPLDPGDWTFDQWVADGREGPLAWCGHPLQRISSGGGFGCLAGCG